MHNWAKSMMECVKTKVEGIGLDNLDESSLCELEKWSCIAKNIAEYDYYYHITEAMEKPENEYGVNYDENGKYYTPMRNSMGRYTNRAYEEYDPMIHMEHSRDMDRVNGRMYYTDSSSMNSSSMRGYSESRYDRARKGFEDAKMMHPESENMEEIKELFEVFEDDIKELKHKMLPSEKSYAKNKLVSLSNTMM